MILLDTNVLSEPMRPKPDPTVLAWLDAQAPESLYLSTVSLAELLLGIESLPANAAKRSPPLWMNTSSRFFADGSSPSISARRRLTRRSSREPAGVAIPSRSQTRRSRPLRYHSQFSVATRDEAPFEAAGVPVINPFIAP